MSGNPNQNPNRNMSMKLKNLRKPNQNPSRPFRLMRATGVFENENDEEGSPVPPAVLNIVVPSRMNSETSLMMGSRTSVPGLQIVSKTSVKSVRSDKSVVSAHSDTTRPEQGKTPSRGDCQPAKEKPKPKKQPSSARVACQEAEEGESAAEGPIAAEPCPPCKFPPHDMKHLQRQLMKYRGEMERCGDAAKINGQLNEIFLRRLFDIERKADGDIDVMLVTYQEWVEMLLQINEVFINNMEDLESEVAERLDVMKRRLKASNSQADSELSKYKQDVCTLVKLIQNAYHNDNWNMCGMNFQTLTPDQVLGLKNAQMYSAGEDSERSMQETNDYSCQSQCNQCPMPPRPPLPCGQTDQSDSRNRCVFEPECELENVVYMPPGPKDPCARDLCGEASSCTRNALDCGACQPQTTPRPIKKQCSESTFDQPCQQNKSGQQHTQANLRALALEVATKHDEICDLKRQVCCMEDEIQKAQQKIQLKDNVIKELRNDLKCSNAKFEKLSREASASCGTTCLKMPPINLEGQQSSRSASTQVSAAQDSCNQLPLYNDDCSQFDSLSQSGKMDKQKLCQLEAELNELFEMASDCKKQNMEFHRKRLSDIFQKSETEKADAYRKLDFIRRQLIDLETAGCGEPSQRCPNDSDSGFSSKCDNDQDAKILNAVRKRLRRLNDTVFDLKKCVQQLQIENNEVSTCFQTEKTFAARNSDTLKEIADLLCGMTGKQFSYEDIYNGDACQPNPFCEAILDMKCEMNETERQLRNAITKRNQQIEELQQSQMEQERANEADGLRQANESLRCQMEHLQRTIIDQEQRIEQLNGMLQQLQCDAKHKNDCCMQAKDQELREMCVKLEQANTKVESLMCQLDHSQKQERFLLCETRKLNDELNESKRKHNDMNIQVHRLASLLKKQESCRTDICSKYEEMEHNYEEQARELRTACTQLNCLQERLATMDKRQEEHNMERNLLREEVLALKEKEATMLDRQKCLSEQLLKTEKELYNAHDVMKEQQSIMQRNDCTQQNCVKRLQDANADLKQQFTVICDDYKRLEDEFKKQCDIRKQNEKVIESFRKWKEAQLKADDSTRASFKQYEDHIKKLLEEKQLFLDQYRGLHRDYCTLQNELERIRLCSYSFSNSAPRSDLSENSISHRMELIRRASRRLSQQSSSLKCDETSQEASGSKSPGELK